jgi:hypothetical protein
MICNDCLKLASFYVRKSYVTDEERSNGSAEPIPCCIDCVKDYLKDDDEYEIESLIDEIEEVLLKDIEFILTKFENKFKREDVSKSDIAFIILDSLKDHLWKL